MILHPITLTFGLGLSVAADTSSNAAAAVDQYMVRHLHYSPYPNRLRSIQSSIEVVCRMNVVGGEDGGGGDEVGTFRHLTWSGSHLEHRPPAADTEEQKSSGSQQRCTCWWQFKFYAYSFDPSKGRVF